jgi:hypothetical protein
VALRQPSAMGLDVLLAIPQPGDFTAAAREWLGTLPGLLSPREWADVGAEARPPFEGTPEPEWPGYDEWQPPFMTWGEIVVAPLKWHGMRVEQRRATSRNLAWLADQLADRPVSAMVSLFLVDSAGVKVPGGLAVDAETALNAANEPVPVARLSVGDTLAWRPGADPGDADELCERQAAVARAWAGRPGVLAVFAGEDTGSMGMTALLHSVGPVVSWWDAVRRHELLGYSWITLCPPAAASRLGGAAALAASGAFFRVEEVTGGAVLLQVTERASGYGISEARRAFEVLAPALPAGLPRKPANWSEGVPWLVIPQDAASRHSSLSEPARRRRQRGRRARRASGLGGAGAASRGGGTACPGAPAGG